VRINCVCFVCTSQFNTYSLIVTLPKNLWMVVQVTFNIDVPMFVAHIFYGWVAGLGNQFKKLVLVRSAALYWLLWTSRNDIVFDNSLIKTYT
jgi:hypothetical protein